MKIVRGGGSRITKARGIFTMPPTPPIVPANRWAFYGDSQTAGPATSPCASHATAFRAIWDANFTAATTVNIDGSGGQGLLNHHTRYNADTHYTNEWVHVQESGGQDEPGQLTVSEWRATFVSFIEAIYANSPSGLITYETAYSFERELEAGRNWDPYNIALYEEVAALAARPTPITVHIVDANSVIKRLVADLGYAVVNQTTGQTPANYTVANAPYHYTEVGNLAIALAIFKKLNYDIRSLNLSSITTNSNVVGRVTEAHVAACIEAADPRIVHGGKYTFLPPSGIDFGAFTGEILFYIDPEQYTNGVTVSGITPTLSTNARPISLQTGENTNLHVRINNNRSSRTNGTKSIFIDWDHPDNTGSDTIAAFGINTNGIGNDVFLSFKKYMEGDYDEMTCNHKELYVFGNGVGELPQALSIVQTQTFDWALYNNDGGATPQDFVIYYDEGLANGNSATAPNRNRTYQDTQNKWSMRNYFFRNNSAPGVADGSAQVDFNNVRVVELNSTYAWQRSEAGEFADIRLGHMAQGFTDTAQANFDEVYAATTRARVELTTQGTYNKDVEHPSAIQPHTSWTSRGITVRVNEGNLPASGPLYARVFNNSGNVITTFQVR